MADAVRRLCTLKRLRARALTVTETLVTMGILASLMGISATIMYAGRRGRAQAGCAANLHSIGNAFGLYLFDFQDSYPAPTANAQWEDLLRPYMPRSSFHCPADNELFTSLGSSYDWRDTGDPNTTLAALPATRVRHTDASLAFDDFPGWHAPGQIQVLKIDGSVDLMGQSAFFKELQRAPAKP